MVRPVKRSVRIAGHPTSVSLEAPFWEALRAIATAQNRPVGDVIEEIDRGRTGGLSSALRLFVLGELRGRLRDAGVDY